MNKRQRKKWLKKHPEIMVMNIANAIVQEFKRIGTWLADEWTDFYSRLPDAIKQNIESARKGTRP